MANRVFLFFVAGWLLQFSSRHFCVCQLRNFFYVCTFTVVGCISYALYTTNSFPSILYFDL